MARVRHKARARKVVRQREILAARQQLVQRQVDVKVLLVRHEVELSAELAAYFRWLRDRLTDEYDTVRRIQRTVKGRTRDGTINIPTVRQHDTVRNAAPSAGFRPAEQVVRTVPGAAAIHSDPPMTVTASSPSCS